MPAELTSHKSVPTPLLATRFFLPPLPPACVSRSRLTGLLEKGLQLPITILSAPPGFGKSSLISEWIHSRPNLKTGWLSLQPSDQDWARFFRYLIAAWQRIFPQVGEAVLDELNLNPSPDREDLANLLLNDLLSCQEADEPEHTLLILDDYHRIESTTIHETVTYLVEHLPKHCHLVLLTRADPPLPVARWRSRGQVLEVRADNLRFTLEEAAEYLNRSMGFHLIEEQVQILHEHTEGWIAGLQMAALAMQGLSSHRAEELWEFVREFGGSSRFVVDYLAEEVVRQQPEEIQQFLLTTALLERFCGPVCDILLCAAAPYSQHILERLERANLFLIPLDDHRHWFRYHHLFTDLLRMQLQQTDPKRIPGLYRRAAEWFAQNGLWRDAIQYALLSKDMDFSASLIEQAILKSGLDFLYSGMKPLIEPFPATVVQNRPLLSLAKAVAIFESSQLEGVESLLRFAEKGILTLPPFPGQEEVLGWIYVIQSDVATLTGDLAWMIEASQQVRLWLPHDPIANIEALILNGTAFYYEGKFHQADTCWQQALDMSLTSNNTDYSINLIDGLARLCFLKGELNRAEALFQQGLHLLAAHPGHHLRWLGAMQRDYSDLLRERNLLEESRNLMNTALPLCKKWHTVSGYGWGLFSMSRILLASGDVPGSKAVLQKVDALGRTHALYPDLETMVQVTRARFCLEEGEAEQAWQMLETCLHSACCQHEFHREWVLVAQARVLVHTNRPAEAINLLSGRIENAKANGRGRDGLVMSLITALALHACGDKQGAIQVLGDVLVFAQGQDFRRIFIDEGERMRALMEEWRVQFPRSPLADYVSEMIGTFPAGPIRERMESLKIEGQYESLSRREVEILRLVCLGLSNQEIANRLVLSVGTVKFHIHNIFSKLDVRDRPQAIAKASLLGLDISDSPG